jgi:hypothetical protein
MSAHAKSDDQVGLSGRDDSVQNAGEMAIQPCDVVPSVGRVVATDQHIRSPANSANAPAPGSCLAIVGGSRALPSWGERGWLIVAGRSEMAVGLAPTRASYHEVREQRQF